MASNKGGSILLKTARQPSICFAKKTPSCPPVNLLILFSVVGPVALGSPIPWAAAKPAGRRASHPAGARARACGRPWLVEAGPWSLCALPGDHSARPPRSSGSRCPQRPQRLPSLGTVTAAPTPAMPRLGPSAPPPSADNLKARRNLLWGRQLDVCFCDHESAGCATMK